jgi:hypothetical protein
MVGAQQSPGGMTLAQQVEGGVVQTHALLACISQDGTAGGRFRWLRVRATRSPYSKQSTHMSTTSNVEDWPFRRFLT